MFQVKDDVVRLNLISGYVVERLPHNVCFITHVGKYDFTHSWFPFVFKKDSGIDALKELELLRNGLKDHPPSALLVVATGAAAAGGIAGPAVVTTTAAGLGFLSGGIAAGSVGAGMMSSAAVASGGGVAAGGVVATLQSIGAVGLAGGPLGVAIAGGAIVTTGVAVGIFFGAKAIQKKVGDHRRRPGGVVHHCSNCDDRLFGKM